MYSIVKKMLFRFDEEWIHQKTLFLMDLIYSGKKPLNPETISGYHLAIGDKVINNPVCLAAGFLKHPIGVQILPYFGFGGAELGTVTPELQVGNTKPRLFRFPKKQAIVNAMGFNNLGIQKFVEDLEYRNRNIPETFLLGISIGTKKLDNLIETILTNIEYINQFVPEKVKKKIDYYAINISSPNTVGLRSAQTIQTITELVSACCSVTDKPIAVKFAPDFESSFQFQECVKASVNAGAKIIIVTNTTKNGQVLSDDEFNKLPERMRDDNKMLKAGMSGLPLMDASRLYLKWTREVVSDEILVISVGGIMSAEEAWYRLCLGADLIQIYTGWIYNGPFFPNKIGKYIEQQLEKNNIVNRNQLLAFRKSFNEKILS